VSHELEKQRDKVLAIRKGEKGLEALSREKMSGEKKLKVRKEE
jgi:hypothetical protein